MGEKLKIAEDKLKEALNSPPSRSKTVEVFKKGVTAYEGYVLLLPALERVIVARNNKNLDKAAIIFNETWARIAQRSRIRKIIPESEIRKFINNKDNLTKFCSNLYSAKRYFKQVSKGLEIGSKIVNISENLFGLYRNHTHKNSYKKSISKAKRLRSDMVYAQRQMSLVMGITAEMASFAPPGMSAYIEYNLKAFQACEKGFKIVNKHAEKIEKLSKEVEKLREVIGSNRISAKSGRETEKMKGTTNQQLDILFKMAE